MKLIHYLYIVVPLIFLAACSSEELPTAEELHPNGAIELSAGIVEGGSSAVTRAGAETYHAKHLALTNGTKLALQVSGTWTGHSPVDVIKTTTATVGAAFDVKVDEVTAQHNNVSCSPVLYWDDYGSAAEGNYDPADPTAMKNDAETIVYGRGIGLTIYGVAINGKTTAPSVSDYTALEWTLAANQTTTNNTPADKDLLISNNVQANPGASISNDGTYKFDERGSGKLLEFRHALSKITVNLKAGAGFTGNAFAAVPTVTLTSNDGSTSLIEWPYTTGTINVTTGGVTSQGNNDVITMNAAASVTDGYNVTKEALVIPGSAFANDAAIIARINADGNIYYVTAEKIRTAAHGKDHTEETGGEILTKAGYNYIINVTVNKTDIVVTATVTDWTNVEAAVVKPVINISTGYGVAPEDGTVFTKDEFSFYRRTSTESTYSDGLTENNYFKEIRRVKKSGSDWTMNIYSNNTWEVSNLYWPDHNTHYQFRGVWPYTKTGTGDVDYPRVEMVNSEQVIKVQNVAYTANSFPSDLQIGRPDVATNETCTNNETDHTTTNLWSGGICATEGKINLKFMYMMSQVEVNLTTNDGGLDEVRLQGAQVELVNVHKTGNVSLDNRTVTPTGVASSTPAPATDTFGDYILGNYTYSAASGSDPAKASYRSAIVPQELTYTTAQAAGNVKFRITITNADNTTDVYYADIAPIKKSGSTTEYVAKHETSPEKWYWESGYHYIYDLKISKTEVKVTATLANWTTVNADENVWF